MCGLFFVLASLSSPFETKKTIISVDFFYKKSYFHEKVYVPMGNFLSGVAMNRKKSFGTVAACSVLALVDQLG